MSGCTPKAVSHRLNNIRSTGKPVNSSGVTASPAGKATAPKTPKTPKTPRPRKIAATPKSNNKRLATPSDSDQGPESFLDDPELKTPTTASRKRARTTPAKNYAEPDSENAGSPSAGVKKVKIEPFEDESEHDCLTAAEENSMFEV